MKLDQFGIAHQTTDDLCALLYADPSIDLSTIQVDDPDKFNHSIKELFYELAPLIKYRPSTKSIDEFDADNQQHWFMPDDYKTLDIAEWVLHECKTEAELQRVGEELLEYQERDLFPLLQFMKYFVDTMRKHNVVWGVGRGSSTASYVLYLIGVHRINSIYYDLDIKEFLK